MTMTELRNSTTAEREPRIRGQSTCGLSVEIIMVLLWQKLKQTFVQRQPEDTHKLRILGGEPLVVIQTGAF